MSRTIENRIVQMQFQNKQFEDAVAQSRQSINLLEKDLKLLEGVQALKNLDTKIQSIDVSNISNGIQTLTDRFSTMGIVGVSVIQNITTSIYEYLLNSLNKATSAFTGLFHTIYERGMNRAKNIEQANFALQGLLSTEYKIMDANGQMVEDWNTIKKKQQDIGKVIDASVSGTAYGYDQAAKIASTLAASYGTSAEGIERIGFALKTVVGVAGQTGQDFDSVARVFSKVAASGKAMNEEIGSISGWGIGATEMIAKYINADKQLQKQINKSISTRKKQRKDYDTITAADIYDAASRGAITADIFMNVFNPFFENAQKANDTLDGITKNIYAALGRLGAAFITPIIKNEGPLVKFLQAVRKILVDVLNGLNKLKIPKNVTDFIGSWLTSMSTFIDNIAKADFSKLPLFERLANVVKTFTGAFSTHPQSSNVDTYSSILKEQLDLWHEQFQTQEEIVADIMGKDFSGPSLWHTILTGNIDSNYANLYSAIKSMFKYRISEIADLKKSLGTDKYWTTDDEILRIYLEYFTKTMGTSFDWGQVKYLTVATKDWKDKILTLMKVTDETTKMTDEIREAMNAIGYPILDDDKENIKNIVEFNNKIKSAILEDWDTILIGDNLMVKDLREEVQERYKAYQDYYDKIPEIAAKLAGEATDKIAALRPFSVDIWQYVAQAITSVTDGLTLLGSIFDHAVSNVFGNNVVTVFDILFGRKADPETVKKIVDKVFIFIANKAEAFSIFIQKNAATFDGVFKGILTIIKGAAKIVGALFKIGVNTIKSFSPLLRRIFDLIVAIFGTINGLDKTGESLVTLEDIVNAISTAIDYLAQGVIIAWDALMDFINLFAPENAYDTLEKFYNIVKAIAEYLAKKWPVWVEKATPYLEKFNEYVKEAAEFIKDKLGDALDFVSPYFDDFANWIKDITDGLVDIKEPIEIVKDVLDDTAPVMETVDSTLQSINETLGAGRGSASGRFLGSLPKSFKVVKGSIFDMEDPIEKIGDVVEDIKEGYRKIDNYMQNTKESADKIGEKFSFISNIIDGIKHWFQMFTDGFNKFASTTVEKIKNSKFIEDIKNRFEKIKKWIEEFDIDRILDVLTRIFGIFNGTMLSYGTASMTAGIGKFLKTFPDMMKMITSTVQSYNPLVMEVKRVDNSTTRINAIASIIKNIAYVIGAFAIGLVAIAASLWIISKIDENRFEQSISTLKFIMWFIGSLVTIILTIATLGQIRTRATAKGDAAYYTTNFLTANKVGIGYIMEEVAFTILAIGAAVLMVTAALWILSKIPKDKLERSIDIFERIMRSMIILVGVILLAALALKQRSSGTTGGSGSLFGRYAYGSFSGAGDWKILIAMAAIIFVIGLAVSGILVSLAIIANLPMNHLDKAIDIFVIVVGALVTLIVLIGLFALLLQRSDMSVTAQGSMTPFLSLIGIAIVLLIIGHVIKEIMYALAIIAHFPMNNLTRGIAVLGVVTIALIAILFVVGGFTLLFNSSAFTTTKTGMIVASLLSLAAVIFVIGEVLPDMMLAMAQLIITISTANIKLSDITLAIGILIAAIASIIIIMAAVAGIGVMINQIGGTKALISIGLIALVFGSIALLALAIGYMIKTIAETGLSADDASKILGSFALMLIGIMAVIAIIGAISASSVYVAIGIAVCVALIFALAALAWAIGSMVTGIGTGVNLLMDAIIKLVLFFSSLNSKQLEKMGKNIRKFFKELSESIIDSIIDFAKLLEKRKDEIVVALVTIISMVLTALSIAIFAIVTNWLDNLSTILHLIHDFLEKHKFIIADIFDDIAALVYVFLSGKDGESGLIGLVLHAADQVIGGLIDIIDKRGPELVEAIEKLCISIIDGIANIVDPEKNSETREKVNSATQHLGSAVANALISALGLNPEEPGVVSAAAIITEFVNAMFQPGIWVLTHADEEKVKEFVDILSDFIIKTFRDIFLYSNSAAIYSPLVYPIIEGLYKSIKKLAGEGNVLAIAVLEAFDDEMQIKSPSKEMYKRGEYVVRGLVLGMKNGYKTIAKASEKMGQVVVDPLTDLKFKAKLLFSSFLTDMADQLGLDEFTITPTMDFTKITEDFGDLDSMLNGKSTFSMDSLSNLTDSLPASEAAEGFDNANLPDIPGLENMDAETMVTFVQNNYSPESLSRIDIYRDTKNILNNPQNLIKDHKAIINIVNSLK